MKILMLVFVMLSSFLLLAQTKVDSSKIKMDDESSAWMNKISSDSEMRVNMMDMMMAKVSGNKEEMMGLVTTILNNPEMNKMITTEINSKTARKNATLSPESRGMMSDTLKAKEVMPTKLIYRK